MDNISNKLTTVIANIKGTQNSLTQANSIVSNEVVQFDDAASYLKTDYEKAISTLTESQRKSKVANIAFFLSEQQINNILDQLTQDAQAA